MMLSTNILLTDLKLSNATGAYPAVYIVSSSYNRFHRAHFANMRAVNYYNMMDFDANSDYNIINDVLVSNWNRSAIGYAGDEATLTQIRVIGTSADGVGIQGTRNTLSHFTNSESMTCFNIASNYATINQILCSLNYVEANFNSTGNYIISQMALFSHETYSSNLTLSSTSNNKFTNNILIHDHNNANRCSVTGGTNPGTTATCGNNGTSDANWVYFTLGNYSNPLVGDVSSDATNPQGGTGSASYASITDWLNFANIYRGWQRSDDSAQCVSGQTCQITDLRLRAADTLVRNRSNDGLNPNTAFTAGATCPAAVHGNKALTDQQTAANTFLINATEIINDGVGDDDGLCESGEECIYSPNFGAYQGEGDYKAAGTCLFQDGTVKAVKMYAYPTNGG